MESTRELLINGRYRVVRLLGRGGMGKVALAQDLAEGGREVALKSVPREQREDLAHVQHEFLTLSRLRHPNVAFVHDFGVIEETGELFFTSEYVPGIDLLEATDLAGFRGAPPRTTWDDLTDWIVQICRGLEYVHSRGLIHYDVKPGNVLVVRREQESVVKIIDFGLAGSRTQLPLGVIKGTVSYMAPEVARSAPTDKRTDLYSLGCTLYQCVTRKLPFRGETNLEVLRAHMHEAPRDPRELRPDLPEHLRTLILRLMAKDPGERYPSANDVIRALSSSSGRSFEVETKEGAAFWVASGSFVGRDAELDFLARGFERALGVQKTGDAAKVERARSPEVASPGKAPRKLALEPRRLVLVSGESGTGKSRLLREFRTYAQLREVAVVDARATREGAPYGPFAEIVRKLLHLFPKSSAEEREPLAPGASPGSADAKDQLRSRLLRHYGPELSRLIPEVGVEGAQPRAPLAPDQERLRLLDSLAQFLLRFGQARPLVVILDDLHEADAETAELLRYLARNLELAERAREMAPRFGLAPPLPLRLLVVASFHASETAGRPLEKVLDDVRGARETVELTLGLLDQEEVARLVQSMLGVDAEARTLASRVYTETKGNPFFVVELMRSLVEARAGAASAAPSTVSIPRTVADVILERVRRLSDEERTPLAVLAVLGRAAVAREIARLLDEEAPRAVARLEGLERRQIVVTERRDDGKVAYSFLHDLAREAILASLPGSEKKRLHAACGRLLEAKLDREGTGGVAPVDLAELIRHFEAAGEPLRALDYAVRAGDEARSLYAARRAIEHYERALALLGKAEPEAVRRRLDLLERLADALALAGDYERASRVMEDLRASEGGASVLEPGERARIERKTGELHERRGAYDLALDAFARGVQELGTSVRSREGATLLGATASVYVKKGLYERAVEFCEAGLELVRGLPEGEESAQLRTIEGVARSCLGELEAAEREFERALVARRRIGNALGTARSLANLGALAVERGRLGEAIERFEAVLELEEKLDHDPGIAEAAAQLARAFRARGDLERATFLSRRALAIQEKTGDAEGQVASWNDLGLLHDALGEHARAIECFRTAVARNERVGEAREAARALNGEASVLARCFAVKLAEPLANEALRLSALHSIKREEARAWRTLGRLAYARGALDEAEQLAHRSLALYRRLGARREAVLVTLDVAGVCTERGDEAITETLLREIEPEAKELGLDRVDAALTLARARHRLARERRVPEGERGSLQELRSLEAELERAAALSERARAPELLWRLLAAQGSTLALLGALDEGARVYVRAMEIVRGLHAALPDELKGTYLDDPERRALREAFRELRGRMS